MACLCTSITLKGGTVIDPLDISEVYDVVKVNDWGCCMTADGLTYDVSCPIIIGDGGATETHFDLRKQGEPCVWRFGDEKDGLELNLGTDDTAILDDSTITTIASVATTGLKITAGTEAHITSAKNLTISTFNTFVECLVGGIIKFVDPNFIFPDKTTGDGTIKQAYTWTFTVLEGQTPIPDCKINVKDVDGQVVTNDLLTDANGQIADQVYYANWWTANVATPKTGHTLRFFEYSYTTLLFVMAVSSKLAILQQMITDPFVNKDKISAGLILATCN